MKRVAGNDILEYLQLGIADDKVNPSKMMVHMRQVKDERADLVFSFLKSWGFAAAFGDALPMCDEHQKKPERIPPEALAMRACELVDATWSELRHRGWIFDVPPIEE
jgi:hypothetical protein